jgi:hypothetical protein
MAPYIVGRLGTPVERAAVDALGAADELQAEEEAGEEEAGEEPQQKCVVGRGAGG